MRLDPQTRSELFLQYEAAGYLDLEPEERAELLKPKEPAKHKGGRGNKKPWVDPTCRSCGEQFPAPRGTRRTMCPSCLSRFQTVHGKTIFQREAADGVAA